MRIVREDVAHVKTKPIVVVADSNKETFHQVKKFLGSKYIVKYADNHLELIRCLRRNEVSAVVLDICLPGILIFTLIPILKEASGNVPITIMASESSSYSEGSIREIGIFDYLQKPIKAEEIRRVVSNAVATWNDPKRRELHSRPCVGNRF